MKNHPIVALTAVVVPLTVGLQTPATATAGAPAPVPTAVTARPTAASRVPTSRPATTSSTVFNHNWAGYVQLGHTTEVSARFVVPRVNGGPTGYASTWVGIDGYTNRFLTQVGVGEESVNGHARYYAWWEAITPWSMPPMQRFDLAIRPGDAVLVRATCGGGRSRVAISNLTTRRSAYRVVAHTGPCGSAEWIQEDVNANGRISPAPNWGRVKFTSVSRNRGNARLKGYQAHDIVDGRWTHETTTSAPTAAGNAFTVTRLRAGTWTAVR